MGNQVPGELGSDLVAAVYACGTAALYSYICHAACNLRTGRRTPKTLVQHRLLLAVDCCRQ